MYHNIIHYACIIDTGTTETMESIGLYNGKIKIISDGCTLDPNAYFEDNTLVGTNWVNLFKLEGLAQTGTRIDITTGGDYAYLTGMNITLANQTLDNLMPYHEGLQQLEQAWLIGAGIQFFVVCDRERFIQRWEGVIDNIAFTDEDFTFSAVDKLVKKFKQLPQVVGDQIAIGNIKYAPMKLVSNEEETVLLESHTIVRILPYGENYCDGTYAQNAEGWSASMWGSDMDIVGFGVQKQWPSQLSQSAIAYFGQRILTPMNNRDYWIILELSQEHPEWIGKTITIEDKDYLIIDTKLDIIPDSATLTNPVPETGLWVLAKDFDANITTEGLFGVPKSIRYATNCVNVADATAVLDSLKQFSTEKVLCTISNKLKVLQFSKDVSLVDLVTDTDGNIIFYTKSADGTMVEVNINGIIDADNNIVIVNESRRREIVTPNRVTVSSSSGMGWQALFDDEYEPIYNDPLGFQYNDTTKWSGTNYNLREVYNGKNLNRTINPDIKCIYASSSTDLTTGKLNPIKLYMEFDNLDIEQEYKPYIFMQSDYYESQQWAATYDSADNHHPAVVLPYNSTLDVPDTDPNHQESNNSDTNLWFGNRSPTHDVNSRSIWADMWVCNIYPVIIHEQHGLITASSLDSNFQPVVPYTFDMPKRVGRSEVLRFTVDNPDFPDDGRYTKMYAYQAALPYAVTTAPIELLPDNGSVGAEITINYWRAYKDSNYTITSIFTNQPVTTGLIRVGGAHSEYIQVATPSGNERQFLLNSIATGNTPTINSEVPVISADDIKLATKEKTTRILLEIQSEYFIDRAVRYLDPGFNGASNNTALLDISPEFLKVMGLGLMIDEPIVLGDLYVSLKSKTGATVPSDSVYGALHYMTDTYSGLLGDYSSLPTDRAMVDPKLWNIGRLISEQKNTFDYVTELCQQSFVTGWTNRMGDIIYSVLNPEFEANDGDNMLVYFTEANIVRDSLSALSLTPLTQVYNEFDIQFAFNYVTNKYDKQYSVKHVDKDAFPPVDASNGNQVADNSTQIIPVAYQSEQGTGVILIPTIYFVEANWKQFFIYNTFDIPGIPLNHAIWGTVTGFESINNGLTTKIRFKMDMDKSIIVDSPDLQLEGTWLSNIYTISDVWTEYVIGISDYMMAKDVWEQCHAGWLENKTINKAPTSLTDLIWATDLTILDSDLASPYEEYAYQYLMLMAKWATRQKWQVEFDIPVNEFNSKLELMQRVKFHDPVLTPDITIDNVLTTQYGVGYITSLAVIPNEDVIKIGLTFEKFGSRTRVPVQPITITETGSAITISETGTAITITEA